MPKFSIIIPVYNVEIYLRDCVNSVIYQKGFTDFEILLIDDGSTDKSGEICDEYSSKYNFVKTIHQKNSGLSAARNAGLGLATGEFLMFLDSDDYISNETLKKLNELITDNSCDMVVYNRYNFWEDQKYPELPISYSDKIFVCGCDCLKELCEKKHFLASMCNRVVKKSIFEKADLFFKEGCLYEDFPITIMVYLLSQKIICSYECLYYYRQRPNSIVHKISEKDIDLVKSVNYLELLLNKNHLDFVLLKPFFYQLVFSWVINASLRKYAIVMPLSKKACSILRMIMTSDTMKKYLNVTYKCNEMPIRYRISAFLTLFCIPFSLVVTAFFFKIKHLMKPKVLMMNRGLFKIK